MNEKSNSSGDTTRSRLRAAFDILADLPVGDRAAWLAANVRAADQRAELLRLLDADAGSGFLDTPAVEHALRASARELHCAGLIGQCIGDFRVIRELGQGGMAAVFLGEREGADFRQQVAIKLLRRGLYSELEQRLFQRERRALAALEHANVARLIDGGVTAAGIPYLVMEYIDGAPITHYANLHALDTDARLRLFLDVCGAVEAAHRNLIVHRDIKPSNILVSHDGTVKLLDFGIAKLIGDEADDATTGTRGVFTPDYAAPEQLRGDAITTATDVFGLGVLLHELLLGVRPSGTPTRRPSSRVNELVPPDGNVRAMAPARLRKVLRGDLDNILLKSLADEPERRYPSAGALAEDIRRHRDGRPVGAHPLSRLYRTRKFVQRHRGGVAITALFVLGILAALGVATWQAHVARQQAQRANATRDFLLGVFDAARAHLPRAQRPTPDALVAAAQRRLAQTTDLDAATHAELLRTLGQVELSLANFTRAQDLFASAERFDVDPLQARRDRVLRAQAQQRAGNNAAAIATLDAELAPLRAQPSPWLVRALDTLAQARIATGAPDDAVALQRESAAVAERVYGKYSPAAIAAALEVGNTLAALQRYPQAIAALKPVLAHWRAAHLPQDDRYVAALASLASAEDSVGDLPHAEARFRELLALKQDIYTAPHDAIATTLRDLGLILAREEKFTEAESLLDRALAMQTRVFGGDHVELAKTWDARGNVAVAQRHFADAQTDYGNAIAMCERAHFADEVCPRARNNLGMAYYRQNQLDAARAQMTKALEERRALFGNDHPTVAYSLSTLANVAAKQHDYQTAVDQSAQALAVLERAGRGASREDALIRQGHAQALWLLDRNADALREIDRTLAEWQRVAPVDKARRVTMLVQKAQILSDLKRADEARRTALEAIAAGAAADELAPQTRQLLRELSGKADAYPDPPLR